MTARELSNFTVRVDVQLRLAIRADLPKLEWFGQYTHYRTLFKRAYREQQEGRRLMLVADCNDFPIGHVFIQLQSDENAIADGYSRAYLYSLRVMELFRGRGIGTRLLREAEAHVRSRGFHWTTIAVAKENGGALRLYERLGYQIFRDDPGIWSYRDESNETHWVNEPCWILEKPLVDLH
mgnify:CR=1 FL=1